VLLKATAAKKTYQDKWQGGFRDEKNMLLGLGTVRKLQSGGFNILKKKADEPENLG